MTAEPITDLDELKNIIMLGLDVWLVSNDSELRHILILLDNLKTMLEDASQQGAKSIVTLIMTNPSISYDEKEKLIDSINTYFTSVEPDDEITGENCQEELLKRFFTGDTKPN